MIILSHCSYEVPVRGLNNRDSHEIVDGFVRLLAKFARRQTCETYVDTRSVYLNGNVFTVAKDSPAAWHKHPKDAIVIDDGIIKLVGGNCEAEELIYDSCVSNVRVFDLDGATALPGFHDVHMHPLEAESPVGGDCKLPSGTRPDHETMTKVLETCNKKQKGTDWILGRGHSITEMLDYIEESDTPPRKILDHFIPHSPVAILEQTSHSVWVNTAALDRVGINEKTPESPGGVIMREWNSNKPNGILLEDAGIKIMAEAMKPNNDIDELNYNGLLYALEELSANGITSICDARLFWKLRHHEAWDRVCNEGLLTVRAILGLWAYPAANDIEQIEQLKKLYTNGRQGCSLRRSQIKLYSDGLLESTTAAMKEPYLFNLELPGMGTENKGMNYFDQNRIAKYVKALQNFEGAEGFDFHIHAIGDRGINEALNAIENANIKDSYRQSRHRLTHLEVIDPKDIYRFKQLGITADFQVAGDHTLPNNHEHIASYIGKKKADFTIPVKSVFETGATVTLSSDWDVSTVNPFVGIYHATMRGDQAVGVETAIEMYTINSAFAMRQENIVGSLVKGNY